MTSPVRIHVILGRHGGRKLTFLILHTRHIARHETNRVWEFPTWLNSRRWLLSMHIDVLRVYLQPSKFCCMALCGYCLPCHGCVLKSPSNWWWPEGCTGRFAFMCCALPFHVFRFPTIWESVLARMSQWGYVCVMHEKVNAAVWPVWGVNGMVGDLMCRESI